MSSDREPAFAVWLTGLPASGKSTVARALAAELGGKGIRAAVLESDAVRREIAPNAGYGEAERDAFYATLAFLARVLVLHGVPVIVDATANRRAYRDRARAAIPRFLEAHVRCPLAVCRGAGSEGDLPARGGGNGARRAGRIGAVRAAVDAGGGRRRGEGRSRGRRRAHRVGAGEEGIPPARSGGCDESGISVITLRAPPRRWRTSRGRRGRSGRGRGRRALWRETTRPRRSPSGPPAPGGSRRSRC